MLLTFNFLLIFSNLLRRIKECEEKIGSEFKTRFDRHYIAWVVKSRCNMHWLVFINFWIYFYVYPCTVEDERADKSRHCCWSSRWRTVADIVASSKLPKSLWYRVKKTLCEKMAVREEQDNVLAFRKTYKRRQGAIRIPEFFKQLQNMIDEEPRKSIRSLIE